MIPYGSWTRWPKSEAIPLANEFPENEDGQDAQLGASIHIYRFNITYIKVLRCFISLYIYFSLLVYFIFCIFYVWFSFSLYIHIWPTRCRAPGSDRSFRLNKRWNMRGRKTKHCPFTTTYFYNKNLDLRAQTHVKQYDDQELRSKPVWTQLACKKKYVCSSIVFWASYSNTWKRLRYDQPSYAWNKSVLSSARTTKKLALDIQNVHIGI